MTLRYMMHAPEAYFSEDAARIAASMGEPEVKADVEAPTERLRSI